MHGAYDACTERIQRREYREHKGTSSVKMAGNGEFQEFVQTLKDKVNLVDVVAGYVTLERRGTSWWGCCPFHHEKTASFVVNESDKYYHCFGCGESGDVIKFVQGMENVDFMDAVKILADRVKLPVPSPTGADAEKTLKLKQKKETCLAILNDAAHFYLANLRTGKAVQHLEYINSRKIPRKVVTKFGLGASLNFTDLPAYLLDKGYSRRDIIDSGVCQEAEARLIDSQGGRLIYPIINAFDEVIAFGGRLLKKAEKTAKYKNTKDTVVFNKSKTLYNINLLKKLRKQQKISEVIVVEGYMDTISLYGAGFTNVVASMGTSLTQDQARLLKRYSDNVLISYDGDSAGQSANARGLDLLSDEGLNVKVVPLPDGMDPDDVIKKQGADGYKKCLDSAMPLIDFRLEFAERGLNLERADERRKYISEALRIVKSEPSASTQEELLKRIRDKTGTSLQALQDELGKTTPSIAPPVDTEKPVSRKDNANMYTRASRFVAAAYLFGAPYTAGVDIDSIPVFNEIHSIILRYVKTCMDFDDKPSKGWLVNSYGLVDENASAEDAKKLGDEAFELWKVLDYENGDALKGPVAEQYFRDSVSTLRIRRVEMDGEDLKALYSKETDPDRKARLAVRMAENSRKLIDLKNDRITKPGAQAAKATPDTQGTPNGQTG